MNNINQAALETIDELFRGENRKLAQQITDVVLEMRDYWPLNVRQVFYQGVSRAFISNTQNRYKAISRLLTKLRRGDVLPWTAFEDRTRRTIEKRGISDLREFVDEQMKTFLDWRYYHRCRVQNQDVYFEVVTEKDALASIMEEAVWPYCCRLNVGKGQISATMIEQMAQRYAKAIQSGQEPVMLYFGDLDPSGVQIPLSTRTSLVEHHGVNVRIVRCALNPDDIKTYQLPQSIDAAKKSDPNYRRWMQKYADVSPTELDALHPRDLTSVIRARIEAELDMEDFQAQIDIEDQERVRLKRVRQDVEHFTQHNWPELFGKAA